MTDLCWSPENGTLKQAKTLLYPSSKKCFEYGSTHLIAAILEMFARRNAHKFKSKTKKLAVCISGFFIPSSNAKLLCTVKQM